MAGSTPVLERLPCGTPRTPPGFLRVAWLPARRVPTMKSVGDQRCMSCGEAIHVDPRFSAWCPHCLWNVDPVPGPPDPQGRQARRQADDRRIAAEVHDHVVREGAAPSSWARAAVLTAAVVVHLATLLLIVAVLRVLVSDLSLFVRLVLLALLGPLVVAVWPRPARLDTDARTLTPDLAPAALAMVEHVAATVGVPAPDVLALDTEYRASLEVVGWRRRPVLVLGWPLWNVLDRQAKVALIAHELGHLASGDVRRTLPVALASDTLRRWVKVFAVGPGGWDRAMYKVTFAPGAGGSGSGAGDYAMVLHGGSAAGGLAALLEVATQTMMRPVAHGFALLAGAFDSAARRAGEPAEYLADQAAARVAGTSAVVEMLRMSALGRPAERAVTTAVNRGEHDIWAAERQAFAELPAAEVDRAVIAGAQRWDRVDAAHPPTHLRLDVLNQGRQETALVVLGAGEIKEMDRELGAQVRRDRVAVTLSRMPSPR
jgi:Zn-dependent protease with chaperone function